MAARANYQVLQGDLQEGKRSLSEVQSAVQSVDKAKSQLDKFATIIPELADCEKQLQGAELLYAEVDEGTLAYGSPNIESQS